MEGSQVKALAKKGERCKAIFMIPSLKFYQPVSSVNCDLILHEMEGTNDGLLKLGHFITDPVKDYGSHIFLTNKIGIHCNFHRWFICYYVVSEGDWLSKITFHLTRGLGFSVPPGYMLFQEYESKFWVVKCKIKFCNFVTRSPLPFPPLSILGKVPVCLWAKVRSQKENNSQF